MTSPVRSQTWDRWKGIRENGSLGTGRFDSGSWEVTMIDINTLKKGDKVWVQSRWAGDYSPIQVTITGFTPNPAGIEYSGEEYSYWTDTVFESETEGILYGADRLYNLVTTAQHELEAFKSKYGLP